MDRMSDPGGGFEAWLRALAREIDVDEARAWAERAGEWLNQQMEGRPGPPPAEDAGPSRPADPPRPGGPLRGDDPLRGAGPHPLDVPTEEQGLALAALESGRWTIEPGTSALTTVGDGPAPSDALGLVRELRVRDWLDADGAVTEAGRRALLRWLDR
jgi:hypothetical protein